MKLEQPSAKLFENQRRISGRLINGPSNYEEDSKVTPTSHDWQNAVLCSASWADAAEPWGTVAPLHKARGPAPPGRRTGEKRA
jgi:hypothetical protein